MFKSIFSSINKNSITHSCISSNNIQMNSNSVIVNGRTISVPSGACIKCYDGKVFVNGKEATFNEESSAGECKVIHLIIDGDAVNINSDCSVEVRGNVGGDIDCNGSVKIGGNVDGDIDCNGSVKIEGSHFGDIDAAGSVSIK